MTTHRTLSTMSLAILGLLVALPSSAQDANYPYFGLKVGQAHGKFDLDQVSSSVLSPATRATITSRDDKDTSYGAFFGYQINRYIAVETGFFSLGRFGYTASTVPTGSLNGQVRVQGGNLDMVGTLPIGERFSVIGRLGGTYARSRATFTGSGAATNVQGNSSSRKVNPEYGIGLQYELSPSFLLRAEAERLRINDTAGSRANVNVYSVSMVFPFGRTMTPAPRAMAAPAYVAQAPAPAPMVSPPAPPPAVVMAPPAPAPMVEPPRRRVSFSAESLFGFDKSTMTPEGMTALDAFARELQGTQFDQVVVEGHTDRLGSTEYNQTLSTQRAEAVKAYLISNGRIDAGKISAVGKSESSPITKAEDCKGASANPRLIACLQPDRRVDVEVTGTR